MAKRFIDTSIFDDNWFMDLTKDGKLFWIYCITKCDHAGIIDINKKLCKFQTGITSIETVIKELGDRLHTISETIFFIPKFIEFQYPGFPRSTVRQQASAIDILCKHGIYDKKINSFITLNKDLPKSYDNDNDNGNGNEEGVAIDEKGSLKEERLDVVRRFYKKKCEKTPDVMRGVVLSEDESVKTLRLLEEQDGFTFDEIKDVLRWSLKDDFWHKQIISISALRKKGKNGNTKFVNARMKYLESDDFKINQQRNKEPERYHDPERIKLISLKLQKIEKQEQETE